MILDLVAGECIIMYPFLKYDCEKPGMQTIYFILYSADIARNL